MAQDTQNYIPVPPDLNSWIRLMLTNFATSFNCSSLATVVSFNSANQTVNLSINYVRVFKNANADPANLDEANQQQNVYLPYPVIVQCPVFIIQGGGSYLTFPITAGDTGLVLFSDRELTTWLTTGQITYPQNQRTHDLSDGIYLGGIRSLLNAISNYNTTQPSLKDQTGERLWQSGMMIPYGGASAPNGFLLCDGSSYSRTQYPLLFAVVGTTYGSIDGSHFNVPDLRGNTAVGIGGTLGLTLGQQFGEITHLLTGQESGIQQHNHQFYILSAGGSTPGPANATGFLNNLQTTQNTGNTNAVNAHNNVQPSLGVQWIIKI